jgi:hypothetical protein
VSRIKLDKFNQVRHIGVGARTHALMEKGQKILGEAI